MLSYFFHLFLSTGLHFFFSILFITAPLSFLSLFILLYLHISSFICLYMLFLLCVAPSYFFQHSFFPLSFFPSCIPSTLQHSLFFSLSSSLIDYFLRFFLSCVFPLFRLFCHYFSFCFFSSLHSFTYTLFVFFLIIHLHYVFICVF